MPGSSLTVVDVLERDALTLGIRLGTAQIRALDEYAKLLFTWNTRYRLVGTRDPVVFARKHLIDSLAVAPVLGVTTELVDIGTGAGLPGIPLAIARPEMALTLIDNRRPAANFLREVSRRLGLVNVRIVEGRIDEIAPGLAGNQRYDATISRAWTSLGTFLRASTGLLRSGGIAIGMKGPKADSELASLGAAAMMFHEPRVVEYQLPGGSEQRKLLIFRRR
jgi:16S rRNA (guanine527-N7)-methyltransferase